MLIIFKFRFPSLMTETKVFFSTSGKAKAIACLVTLRKQPELSVLFERYAEIKKATSNTMVLNGNHKNLRQQLPMIKKQSTYIISEHVGEESHHNTVLSRVFLTESTNCLYNHHL